MVLGTRDELHRVALNLMENAVKHTPDGTQIRARVERQDGTAVLTIEDDGPGSRPSCATGCSSASCAARATAAALGPSASGCPSSERWPRATAGP